MQEIQKYENNKSNYPGSRNTFSLIIGFDSYASILYNTNESKSPEHYAVDTQVVFFRRRLQWH